MSIFTSKFQGKTSKAEYLLSKILDEVDPRGFTYEEIKEEFGNLGNEIGQSGLPMNLGVSFQTLLRLGLLEGFEEEGAKYRVTDAGYKYLDEPEKD